jgi:hypothetical protein
MGFLALVLIGFAGWLIFTGRLARLTGKDGMMLGLAIVGAVMIARGGKFWGAIPLGIAALYAMRRWSAVRPRPMIAEPQAVSEARALLGVGVGATAEDIRAAHRRLIAKIHPDAGGTEALAEKINEARSILLQHLSARDV